MESDDELWCAWVGGSNAAGSKLLRRHTGRVHRFFASKVREAADDLTQRTLLACLESRTRTLETPVLNFRAYLFGIARFQLLKYLRTLKRDGALDPLQSAIADLRPDATASQRVAQREDLEVLTRARQRLPVDHQVVLELFYWEELSVVEIAGVMNVAVGTVKSRLFRAKSQLKEDFVRARDSGYKIDASRLPRALRADLEVAAEPMRDRS